MVLLDLFGSSYDFDPRTRYTIWGATVGEFLGWLAVFAATQVNIQRFGSIPTISGVKMCVEAIDISMCIDVKCPCVIFPKGPLLQLYWTILHSIALHGGWSCYFCQVRQV